MEHAFKMLLVIFALVASGAIVLGPLWIVDKIKGDSPYLVTERTQRRDRVIDTGVVAYYCCLVLLIIYFVTG